MKCANCEYGQEGCIESCIDCECARCIRYESNSDCCLGAMFDRYAPFDGVEEEQ